MKEGAEMYLLEKFDANRQAVNPQDTPAIEGFPKVVISCFSE